MLVEAFEIPALGEGRGAVHLLCISAGCVSEFNQSERRLDYGNYRLDRSLVCSVGDRRFAGRPAGARTPVQATFKAVMPLFFVLLLGLCMMTYLPSISLAFVRAFF